MLFPYSMHQPGRWPGILSGMACLLAGMGQVMLDAAEPAPSRPLMTTPTLCTLASGPGPEDLDLIEWKGRTALLTATYSRARFPKEPHPKPRVGALEIYLPGEERFKPAPMASKPLEHFAPVGLSVVRNSLAPGLEGKQLAYVTNAYPGKGLLAKGGSVEVFEVDDEAGQVKHLGTLGNVYDVCDGRSELLHKINGITASRDGTVYATTFGTFPSRSGETQLIEPASPAGQKRTINSIVCFTPNKDDATKGSWGVVASGINGANGLALSPGETLLYCNAYHGRQILAFERNEQPGGGLKKCHGVVYRGLPFRPDNLKCPPNGELWCTGQRSPVPTFLHLLSGARLPSRGGVARLHWDAGQFKLRHDAEWLKDLDGDKHAPSVALPLGDAFYLGHIMHSGVTEVRLHPKKQAPVHAASPPNVSMNAPANAEKPQSEEAPR
ncbi:SMP-30/gluconolactonase/LRE family protein [Verrucomicrobium sp. BvORR034]|uniref:SMP-30/gluconolactonase/LRE family protein n=1 Tax=Verrucomicrobium sp. BvORR034 TaxID=1396418 RepID=UPI002240F0E7|nr:SMP-30/gluconolactonase/LRE family protein [Verrucomicrobium sp. BvORR034]